MNWRRVVDLFLYEISFMIKYFDRNIFTHELYIYNFIYNIVLLRINITRENQMMISFYLNNIPLNISFCLFI